MRQLKNLTANGLNLRVKGPRRLRAPGDSAPLQINIAALTNMVKEVTVHVGCEPSLCLNAADGVAAIESAPVVMLAERARELVSEQFTYVVFRVDRAQAAAHAVAAIGCNVTDKDSYLCPPGPAVDLHIKVM